MREYDCSCSHPSKHLHSDRGALQSLCSLLAVGCIYFMDGESWMYPVGHIVVLILVLLIVIATVVL